MEPVYIFGHRRPDTDSVCSAIALAELKKLQGQPAVACRLGDISSETRFILDRFGFPQPALLEDARYRLRNLECDPPACLGEEDTIQKALQVLQDSRSHSAAVLKNEKLTGIVTLQDLARIGLQDTAYAIELLKQTPTENIREVLNGTILVEAEDPHINGKVSIVAQNRYGTANYDVKDRIVIVGADAESQLELISKGAGMLICVWTDHVYSVVQKAAKERNCSIILSAHGSMNTSRYLFYAPSVRLIMKQDVQTLTDDLYIDEAEEIMRRSRFRNYPVINAEGRFTGFFNRPLLLNAPKRPVILVDHNAFAQSVPSIEQARILQVVDHHRIADFTTPGPVQFRNECLGSTASIVTGLYQEAGVPIPPAIAGLLVSAVLSDTLKFQSPTCTERDRHLASELAGIAGLDLEDWASELFSAATSLEGKTPAQILSQDCKDFTIGKDDYRIAQVLVYSLNQLEPIRDELQAEIEALSERLNRNVLAAFTSLERPGSSFLWGGKQSAWMQECFGPEPASFQEGIVSRKLQIVPRLYGSAG